LAVEFIDLGAAMENDSIRASGDNTLIDIWVEGKVRAICITREAIEAAGGFESGLSEELRCEFVRTHLPEIANAAKGRLRENAAAETIIIDRGQIGATGDTRKRERRKTDRRTATRATADLPEGERRHGERRRRDRRRSAKSPS
jgi:hypothetical protein